MNALGKPSERPRQYRRIGKRTDRADSSPTLELYTEMFVESVKQAIQMAC